jgi:hypothetical protein
VTMMGPSNCYITVWTGQVSGEGIHQVRIGDPNHGLNGVAEDVLLVRGEVSSRIQQLTHGAPTTSHVETAFWSLGSDIKTRKISTGPAHYESYRTAIN